MANKQTSTPSKNNLPDVQFHDFSVSDDDELKNNEKNLSDNSESDEMSNLNTSMDNQRHFLDVETGQADRSLSFISNSDGQGESSATVNHGFADLQTHRSTDVNKQDFLQHWIEHSTTDNVGKSAASVSDQLSLLSLDNPGPQENKNPNRSSIRVLRKDLKNELNINAPVDMGHLKQAYFQALASQDIDKANELATKINDVTLFSDELTPSFKAADGMETSSDSEDEPMDFVARLLKARDERERRGKK